ncbi:hypothetical protein WICMUC_001415 [Wickerhamomyces mucosus]|uniref:Uncharacterized protein n=1 Tax=Wickerhamomyces mucosus TaxID=1378264 RepID=A0A9P8PU49_9ASCO|nr:hypothetical protein WICMUC_001415 [Wickerhamomyces mucosus]
MSGIFDKYLNMINGSKNTSGQMNTSVNTSKYTSQIYAKDHYVPYQKKERRSSSVSSESSGIGSIESLDAAGIGSNAQAEVDILKAGLQTNPPVKKRLSEPNNRVNF